MCDPAHVVRIYVHDKEFSYDKMPGFLCVPYNFDFEEFRSYFEQSKDEIFRVKKRVIFSELFNI